MADFAGSRLGRLLLVVAGTLCAAPAAAQQLAGETLDVRHGLSNNEVEDIYQDRAGYLWVATWEGLNRFDGRRFERYDTAHGLPPRVLNAIAEDPGGRLWVGTNGSGLAHFVDGPMPRFELTSVGLDRQDDFINEFAFDRRGRVWCTTDSGLIVGEPGGGTSFRFSRVRPYRAVTRFAPVTEHADGRLWIGMGPDLVVLDGTSTAMPVLQAHPTPANEAIVAIVAAQNMSTVIVITTRAVFEFNPDATERWRRLNGSPPDGTTFYAATRAFGALWIGAEGRVLEIRGDTVHSWRIGRGLRPPVSALRADRDGNLWIGTTQGLFRVPPWRIVEFTPGDGLPSSSIARLLVAPGGRVFASTIDAGLIELTDAGPQLVAGTDREPFNRPSDRVVVTKEGLWLVATAEGIFRLHLEPQHPRMRPDSDPLVRLPGIERLQIDATERLWVRLRDRSVVYRVEGERLVPDDSSMVPDQPMPTFMTVVSTPGDSVWLGDMVTLHRRTGNRLEQLHATTGLLETRPRSTLLDSRGWLWIGMRYEGLSLTTNPAADSLRFESLTMKSGLSSNIVSCLAEGKDGYVYAGTGRGIDRLDPATRHVEAVGPASVLSGAWVRSCVTDQSGRIWASTVYGVARIDAFVGNRTTAAAPLYITRVEIDGVPLGLPSLGRSDVGDVELPPGTNSLHLGFSSPALRPERRLNYEYRMMGLDDDWRVADESRAIEYGRIPVGRYRFEVQAVEPGSRAPLARATLSVTALAPLYARPWFLAVLGATLALVGFAAHRLRLRQVLALEHVRQQVALDLHDDIGSGLAEIAILSEVAKREPGRASAVIDDVGRLSRRLRESMADIVWAVDPRFDTLEDVAARIREAEFNLVESQRIALTATVPEAAILRAVRLDAQSRRHLLLLAKELVTNAAKHSGATAVEITLAVERERVLFSVKDNGHGFDTHAPRGNGHGLRSLAHRTARVGGTIELQSSPAGTTVRVSCPLRRPESALPLTDAASSHERVIDSKDDRA